MKLTLSALATLILLGSAQFAAASTNPLPERDIRSPIYDARIHNQSTSVPSPICDTYAYGTGDDSCGTATGGPVGGLISGN